MKTPIDIVRGRIVDYDPRTQRVKIEAFYPDWPIMVKRGYRECNVQMIDSRPLSDKQRRTCYKLIREISNYTGMGLDPCAHSSGSLSTSYLIGTSRVASLCSTLWTM